jgi:hypothetical protein
MISYTAIFFQLFQGENMKTKMYLFSIIFLLGITSSLFAQASHDIDFEPAGVGADWEWVVSENGSNPPLEFIANPNPSGINTSATVAKFTALQAGNPWALFFTDDDGEFTFDASNVIVKIMVHKTEISPVNIKFEGGTGVPLELADTNTVVNQWEELTYDFTDRIGSTFGRMVIIPDLQPRAQDNIVYIDNIEVPDGVIITLPEPTVAAPTPMHVASTVMSVFSDVYTNVPGTDFNPNWGQATQVSQYVVQGDTTLLYETLNYQGTQFADSLDVSAMTHMHIDFWTPNSTDLGIFLINEGILEVEYVLIPPGATETWVSVDIPLSAFAPVDLTNVGQLKVDGNGTIYFDNIYFHTGVVPVELTSFSASVVDGAVMLEWTTATETNNSGFSIEKSADNQYFTEVAFVEGKGTTTEITNYSYVDSDKSSTTAFYRLKQIDFDGSYSYSNTVEVKVLPTVFELEQNFPNPFNPTTNIKFSMPEAQNVTLKIFNMLGQEIKTLVNEFRNAGVYEVSFDANNLPTGTYFYSITAGDFTSTKKMLLIK